MSFSEDKLKQIYGMLNGHVSGLPAYDDFEKQIRTDVSKRKHLYDMLTGHVSGLPAYDDFERSVMGHAGGSERKFSAGAEDASAGAEASGDAVEEDASRPLGWLSDAQLRQTYGSAMHDYDRFRARKESEREAELARLRPQEEALSKAAEQAGRSIPLFNALNAAGKQIHKGIDRLSAAHPDNKLLGGLKKGADAVKLGTSLPERVAEGVNVLREKLAGDGETYKDYEHIAPVIEEVNFRRQQEIQKKIDEIRKRPDSYRSYRDYEVEAFGGGQPDVMKLKPEALGAIQELEKAQRMIAAPSRYGDESGVRNWLRGVGDRFRDADSYTLGATEIYRNLKIMRAYEKLGRGEDLTDAEQALIDGFSVRSNAEQERSMDLSLGYQGGQSTVDSIQFMLEMAATNGVGSLVRKGMQRAGLRLIGSGVGKAAKASSSMLSRGVGKALVKGSEALAQRGSRYTLGNVVGVAASPSTYQGMTGEMADKAADGKAYGWKDALASVGDALVERATENAGGDWLSKVGKGFKGKTASAIRKMHLERLQGFYDKYSNSAANKALMEYAGVHGILEETGEEYLGACVNMLRSLDPAGLHSEEKNARLAADARSLFTPDGTVILLGSIVPSVVGMKIPMYAGVGIASRRFRKSRSEVDDLLQRSGLTAEQAKHTLMVFEREEDLQKVAERGVFLAHAIADAGERANGVELSDEERVKIVDAVGSYMNNMLDYRRIVGDIKSGFDGLTAEQKEQAYQDFSAIVQDARSKVRRSEAAIAAETNRSNGHVQNVYVDGNTSVPYVVVKGNLVVTVTDDGKPMVDKQHSDATFVLSDDKGDVVQVGLDRISGVIGDASAEELCAKARDHVSNMCINQREFGLGTLVYNASDPRHFSAVSKTDGDGFVVPTLDDSGDVVPVKVTNDVRDSWRALPMEVGDVLRLEDGGRVVVKGNDGAGGLRVEVDGEVREMKSAELAELLGARGFDGDVFLNRKREDYEREAGMSFDAERALRGYEQVHELEGQMNGLGRCRARKLFYLYQDWQSGLGSDGSSGRFMAYLKFRDEVFGKMSGETAEAYDARIKAILDSVSRSGVRLTHDDVLMNERELAERERTTEALPDAVHDLFPQRIGEGVEDYVRRVESSLEDGRMMAREKGMADGAAEAVGAGGSASQGEGVALPDERVDVKDLRFTIAEIDKQIAGNKKLLERPTDLRDKKAIAKKLSAMEHLEVLEAERAQYAKLLAEHEGGGDVAQGSMRSVSTEGAGERVNGRGQETMSQGAAEAAEKTAGQGNPLTDEEVAAIADAMKANATIAPTVEINDANWKETVDTPIGSVKMGENQKAKLFTKGREQQYGMVIETLSHPDVVLEEKDKEQNMRHERPSLYLFVKTFQKQDGSRYVNFESVTVSHEGMEVAISSHIIRENQLKNKLKSDRLLYKATALDAPANTSAEQPIVGGSLSSERQAVKEGGHILTPESAAGDTQNALSSGGKGSEVSDTKQENLSENDRANLSELKDFAVRTDSGKRTTVDAAGFDSENLTVPLLVDGKPSRLSVATIVPDGINDRAYQTAVYDYSDDIDDKTNSGWKKWEDLSDEYNSKVSDEERATVFGDSAELHFKTVDAAVKFDDRLRSGSIEEEQSADDLHNDAAVEQPATRGVPDASVDVAKHARARGYRVSAGHVIERQEPQQGLRGKAVRVSFSTKEGDTKEGVVKVVEADRLQPSHRNGRRNLMFFITEAQPKERVDENSRLSADRIAKHIDPVKVTVESNSAYTGAPSTNSRGEVIQGNNRVTALQLMYEAYPEQAAKYKQYLVAHAAAFGLDGDAIALMERPVLTWELDVSDEEAIRLGQKTAADLESGGYQEIDVHRVSQQLGPEGLERMVGALMRDTTEDSELSLNDLIRRNAYDVLGLLHRRGIINGTQMMTAFNHGRVTESGLGNLKDLILQLLYAGEVSDNIHEMFEVLPMNAQKAILQTIARDFSSAKVCRLAPYIQEAIEVYYFASQSEAFRSAKKPQQVLTEVMAWSRQRQMSFAGDESFVPAEKYSNFAFVLAATFKGMKMSDQRALFNAFYDKVQGVNLSADMFAKAERLSFREAVERVYGVKLNDKGRAGGAMLNDIKSNGYDGNRGDVLVGDGGASAGGERGGEGAAQGGERSSGARSEADGGAGARGDSAEGAAVELSEVAEREAPDGVFRKADGALRGRALDNRYKVFAEDLMERWGLPKGLVRWVSAVTEIPQGERSAIREIMRGSVVRGWFNPKTGGVYLYGGGISSQRDVEETLRHELVAHFGVRALFPQTAEGMAAYNGFLDKVFALMQAADRDYFYEYVTGKKATDADLKRVSAATAGEDYASRRAMADEFMAALAEREDFGSRSGFARLMHELRKLLEALWGKVTGRPATFGEDDLRAMLNRSFENLRSGKALDMQAAMAAFERGKGDGIERQHSYDELHNDTAAKQLATRAVMEALDKAGISVEVVSDETASQMLGENDAKAESANEEALGTADHVRFMRTGGKKKSAPETASPDNQDHSTVVSSADGAKVLKSLDNVIKKYENRSSNRSKTFMGDVAKALGATRHGSASEYATFETKNGRIITIRLSNHNGKVSTFDSHNEENGISIVLSNKENKGITNDGTAHVKEYYYPEIKLNRADGKPLVEILRSIRQALYSGVYQDNTGLAEVQEVNVPAVGNGQTDRGTVYGWTVGGKIYLTKDGINPNTPIHEYTHLWAGAMRQRNAEGWQRVKELLRGTPIWNEVLGDPNYGDISGDEDAVASEALSRVSGRENAGKMEAEAQRMIDAADGIVEKAEAVSLLERMRRALDVFWRWVGENLFKIRKFESIEEVTDRVLYDLTTGTDLDSDRSLMAVHNISVDKLRSALELGGFPMPSIAITNANMGHSGYGDISLVFGKESIDPSKSRNKVYSGDAWTPTFPRIGYKLNDKKTNEIYRRTNEVGSLPLFNPVYFHPDNYERKIDGRGDASLVDSFKEDYGAKQMYLAEKGNAVRAFVQHEVQKYSPEKASLYKKILETIGLERLKNDSFDSVKNNLTALGVSGKDSKYERTILAAIDYAENGNSKIENDIDATEQEIDKRIDGKSFSAWLKNLFAGVVEKRGIRNDRDTFTSSGSSRKWESLYDAVTLDNVIKSMRQQAAKGGEGFFNSSIFGASTKELPSIDAVRREAKLRINSISDEQMEKARGRIIERLEKVSIPSVETGVADAFDFVENVINAVSKSHSPSGIYKYLHTYYPDMTMEAAKEISDIVGDIQKMSVRYFEAKPYRAVGFDEVRAAVVPNDVPQEIIDGLQERGVKVVSYEKGDEQERKDALSSVTREMDIRFQIKGSDKAFDGDVPESTRNGGLSEEELIAERGKGDGSYMQAPNGKPSNLTRRQWAQVRTNAFKAWFGDWELKYKKVNVVSAKSNIFKNFDEARAWANQHIARVYSDEETGGKGEIEISHSAIEKYFNSSSVEKSVNAEVHKSAISVLPEIIRNSIVGEVHPDYIKKNGVRSIENGVSPNTEIHRLFGAVAIDGEIYRVKTTVKYFTDKSNKNKAHSYEVVKIELMDESTSSELNPDSQTVSPIQAAKLLQGVEKSYENGKFLLDDYSKMVDENGEPMVFYHNTDADFTVFDSDKNGTHTDAGWLGDGFYFYGEASEGGGYGKNKMAAYLNIREPYYASSEENSRLAEADDRAESIAFREELEEDGYDGVYYDGDLRKEAVVFNANQIKSATENVGSFSGESDDVRFSVRKTSYNHAGVYRAFLKKLEGKHLLISGNESKSTSSKYMHVEYGDAYFSFRFANHSGWSDQDDPEVRSNVVYDDAVNTINSVDLYLDELEGNTAQIIQFMNWVKAWNEKEHAAKPGREDVLYLSSINPMFKALAVSVIIDANQEILYREREEKRQEKEMVLEALRGKILSKKAVAKLKSELHYVTLPEEVEKTREHLEFAKQRLRRFKQRYEDAQVKNNTRLLSGLKKEIDLEEGFVRKLIQSLEAYDKIKDTADYKEKLQKYLEIEGQLASSDEAARECERLEEVMNRESSMFAGRLYRYALLKEGLCYGDLDASKRAVYQGVLSALSKDLQADEEAIEGEKNYYVALEAYENYVYEHIPNTVDRGLRRTLFRASNGVLVVNSKPLNYLDVRNNLVYTERWGEIGVGYDAFYEEGKEASYKAAIEEYIEVKRRIIAEAPEELKDRLNAAMRASGKDVSGVRFSIRSTLWRVARGEAEAPAVARHRVRDAVSSESVAADAVLLDEYARFKNAQQSGMKVVERAFVDDAKPIEDFQEWMQGHGARLSASCDAYSDVFLAKGRVSYAMQRYSRTLLQPLARAMQDIMRSHKLSGIDLRWQHIDSAYSVGGKVDGTRLSEREVLGVYLQAKDCAEALELGLPDRGAAGFVNNVGVTHEAVIEMVEGVLSPEVLSGLWSKVRAATGFALDYEHEAGLLDDATYALFRDRRSFYVPQRGWRERDKRGELTSYLGDAGVYRGGYNAALLRSRGRVSLSSDPLCYISSIANSAIVSSENNRIKQKFLEFVLAHAGIGHSSGAFKVERVWVLNRMDASTGRVLRDAFGVAATEVSFTPPTMEQEAHDRRVRAGIVELQRMLGSLRKELAVEGLTAARKDDVLSRCGLLESEIGALYDSLLINTGVVNEDLHQRSEHELSEHRVFVVKDGVRYVIVLRDESLANALNKSFRSNMDGLLDIKDKLRNVTRFISASLTQYNPEFAFRNVFRDYQTALTTLLVEHPALVGGFMRNFVRSGRAIMYHAFGDKVKGVERYSDDVVGVYLREYFEHGSATGFSFMKDLDLLSKDFDAMLRDNDVKRFGRGCVGLLSMLTEMSELSVRFSAYLSARESGMSADASAILSKELTTNFDRSGALSDTGWMCYFSFFRATINGNVKFFRGFRKYPVGYSLAAGVFAALGLLFYLFSPNDPDDEVWNGDYSRESNFIFGNLHLPVGHFLRMFYCAGANLGAWLRKDKTYGDALFDAMSFASSELFPNYLNGFNFFDWDDGPDRLELNVGQYVQGAVPTVVSPLSDIALNLDYKGAPITREPFVKGVREEKDVLQRKVHTPEFYKRLSMGIYEGFGGDVKNKYKGDDSFLEALVDVSPETYQHLVEGYMPSAAGTVLLMSMSAGRAMTGEVLGVKDVPFARKFYTAYNAQGAYEQEYWKLKRRMEVYGVLYDSSSRRVTGEKTRLYDRAKFYLQHPKRNATADDVRVLMELNRAWNRLQER